MFITQFWNEYTLNSNEKAGNLFKNIAIVF